MVDPVTGGLIGWACGKLGDSVLKHLPGDRELSRQVDKAVAKWAKSLPKDRFVNPDALFPYVDPSTARTERPEYCALQAKLVKGGLPENQMWLAVFAESWRCVRAESEEPQPFFQLAESEASKDLEELAEATYNVCVKHEPIFKQAVIGTLGDIDAKIDDIRQYLREVLELRESPPGEKVKAMWPEVSLPLGGPKVSEPFAGRREELESLTAAMGGDRTAVAVVGMAGQGKSCLAGEWYTRGARPPEGVGLIWRKVYEAGYTFDRFVDELHVYLTGERIDRLEVTTIEARTQVVEAILRDKPCWIVLDGVERWLKRWVAEPDAGIEGLTADDRAAQDPVLDKFLKGASFWEKGSRLLLTTRAVPSALGENLPSMIGQQRQRERRLESLKPDEAAELLKELGVDGDEATILEAADAYGNHPYAVHVLGALIRDLYGGDVSRWEEVNPLREAKLEGLFERIIEHREQDLELLELVACSVGPAPVRMLAEKVVADEVEIRRKLAELAKWQMVEFDKGEAGQHTVVRKFLTERMGTENARETQKSIAGWWAEQDVPTRTVRIEQIRPLLRAVDHLLAAGDPDAATDILDTSRYVETYATVNGWLRVFGYLDEGIRISGEVIRVYVDLVETEGRRELRNDLAMSYNNRGNAYRAQGKLSESIADYGRAIEIYEQLVETEGRRELRNDLAKCYNNRGVAYRDQGNLSESIADYGRAIEIYEQLVETEGRRELRNDLASCYNNRGAAYRAQGKIGDAIADYGRAIEITEQLVEKEGRRELRNDLASCYNNRGIAYSDQGKLTESIADYGRAVAIYEQLVETEGRRDLRNDLASCYNNRGTALRTQGKLTEAIADYSRAIEIREQLVETEGRRELRWGLWRSLFNRVVARTRTEEWKEAGADIDKGGGLLRELISEGQRHVIGSFMQTAAFRCAHAQQLGDVTKAAPWANDAMRWFVEEVRAGRSTEMLLNRAGQFSGLVEGNLKVLLKNELDKGLWERFQEALKEAGVGGKS